MANSTDAKLLWSPSAPFREEAVLSHYLKWLGKTQGLNFDDYQGLWAWSIESPAAFWGSIWAYFEVIGHSPWQEAMSADPMPHTRWFEGATLNYAEHVFRMASADRPALLFKSERTGLTEWSWEELRQKTAALRAFLAAQGVGPGDRVVGYLPNIPEASVAFLATCSLGAVWSSCSPDFGANSVMERFEQIAPKVLIAVDGYQYGGKPFDRLDVVAQLAKGLPGLGCVVLIPYLHAEPKTAGSITWAEALSDRLSPLVFEAVPFAHPIWVLYSSGTTGAPKAITHSQGGVLLEHLKYLAFHNDVRPGDRFFWFTTTGWMMWNFVQAAWLRGATVVLYDGNPGYPSLDVLWQLAEDSRMNHFGTSAPFLVACMKTGLSPGHQYGLSDLRSISSTGSPLPPEAFTWVYEHVKRDLWLCSMSGGTDVCTAFVGGNPLWPVYEGEVQCRALGCSLFAWNDEGQPVTDEVGEMVITQPMPSMPVFFWNDPDGSRYYDSYFDTFPGVWRHGDWVKITPRQGLVIYGRSDATLNRHGVRIGTAEIYNALNHLKEVKDSLIINLELSGGRHYMPLFVLLAEGATLTQALTDKIKLTLRTACSPRHVPDEIIEAPDIPYTISGKKLEAPVKKIMLGFPIAKAANPGAMRNPDSLAFFVGFAHDREW